MSACNNTTTIGHECHFSSEEAESLSICVTKSSVQFNHVHPRYSFIVEHVDELLTPSTDKTSVEKIKHLLLEVDRCLRFLEDAGPEKKKEENATCRKTLNRTIEEDRRILHFLENLFIQQTLRKKVEAELQQGGSTRRKWKIF